MGLFTSLAEMVVTGFGNPDSTQAKLASAVVKRFQTNDGGGLTAILQQMEAKGLGQVAQSWVGTGANQPITPDQLKSALGADWIQQLAAQRRSLSGRHQLASLGNPAEDRRPPHPGWSGAGGGRRNMNCEGHQSSTPSGCSPRADSIDFHKLEDEKRCRAN